MLLDVHDVLGGPHGMSLLAHTQVTRDLANIGIPDSKVSTKGIQSTLFFVPDPNYKPDADESTT